MARRKLFLTHAGELAHRLVTAIARNGMAIEFVRAYGQRYHRPKIAANAERLREMESTISREALLLIAADVRRLLPQAFGSSRVNGAQDLELCDLFYREFLDSLGRALEWPSVEAEAESEAFARDLAIYTHWRERNPSLQVKGLAAANDAPFPDRCAILLDAAMMEQARRAAAIFQTDLLRTGARIFGRLGRQASRSDSSRLRGRSGSSRARKGAASAPAKRPRSERESNHRAKSPRRRR